MKPDKYNPKFPRKHDGQCPDDWLHPDFYMCVSIVITPVRRELTLNLSMSSYFNMYGLPQALKYDFWDHEQPYKQTCATLEQLMPSKYAIKYVAGATVMHVYCNEWIDPTILMLSNDVKDNIITRYSIKERVRPAQVLVNRIMGKLINRVQHEVY